MRRNSKSRCYWRRSKWKWENTENKLRLFIYDELEITDELYIERAHRVIKREGVNANSNNIPKTIVANLLDYKEKEEIMWHRYKLKETTY